jgi:hypothetical protein
LLMEAFAMSLRKVPQGEEHRRTMVSCAEELSPVSELGNRFSSPVSPSGA